MTIHTRLNTIELPALTRAAEVRSASFDATANTVDVIWTTGATVRRVSFLNGAYDEELVVTPQAVRLDRLNNGAPFLNSHDGNDVSRVIGSVVPGTARISNGAGTATIQLSRREDVAGIVKDIRDGIIRNVSVGYRYHRIEKTEAVDGKLPTWRVVDWEPLELSAVAIGADPGAQVRSRSGQTYPCTVAPSLHAIAQEAVRAETARANTIRALGRQWHREDLASEHIRRGTSADGFRAILQTEKDARMNRIQITRDERETRNRGMSDAIAAMLAQSTARPGQRVDVPAHARSYVGRGLAEIAAECIGHKGRLFSTAEMHQVVDRAFLSSPDFPGIFANAINARLLARYAVAAPTYRMFFAKYNLTDFRPANVIRVGDFPVPQQVLESGEIKSGHFSESKELFQLGAYATTVNLTRQMLVNDNLAALDQILGGAGDRVAAWENGLAFALLTSGSGSNGPTLLTDGLQVFEAATHANLAAVPSAIDIANLGIGRAAMAKQKSLDGLNLNLFPTLLLCGPDKQTQAEQVVASIAPALIGAAVPEALRRLVPVADSNLSGNVWYLFASPSTAPCFVYGYLEGFEGPRLSIADAWSVQGVKIKVECDFGVAAIDFRGGFKNAGT